MMEHTIWPVDAANINLTFNIGEYIAKTSKIEDFLEGSRYIIAAPKGYGKTLLLKYAYQLINEKYENSYIPIPSNTPIDSFENGLSYDHKKLNYLSSPESWRKLWYISIGISSIAHYALANGDKEILISLLEQMDLSGVKSSLKIDSIEKLLNTFISSIKDKTTLKSYAKSQANPSALLNLLCATTLSKLEASTDWICNCIHQHFISIDRKSFIFLDQIDQGMTNYPVEIWKSAQIGLVNSIYNLHNSNKHISIYCTIRKEAWDSCKDELATQFNDYVCELNYTAVELKDIFVNAIKKFETRKSVFIPNKFESSIIESFTGLDEVNNHWCGVSEDTFEYIFRHTLRRPRDLMRIGKSIHELKAKNILTHVNFVDVINKVPATELDRQYLEESIRFTESLQHINFNRFFVLTKKNVYRYNELVDLCSMYNTGIECKMRNQTGTCRECLGANHILCDLYRIGLLGIVTRNEIIKDTFTQHFERAGKVRSEHLPQSDYYLFHPALEYYIKNIYHNNTYRPIRGIVVGHEYPWEDRYTVLIELAQLEDFLAKSGIQQTSPLYKSIQEIMALLSSDMPDLHECKEDIQELRQKISSEGFLSSSQFINNIFQSVDLALKHLNFTM